MKIFMRHLIEKEKAINSMRKYIIHAGQGIWPASALAGGQETKIAEVFSEDA